MTLLSRSSRRLLTAALATCALLALIPAASQAAVTPGPAGDAFYTPPATLPSGNGKVIWASKVTGPLALKSASATYRVLYTSTSYDGKPVAVSGLVHLPKGKAPKGGWKVISWAHGTTGSADVCAPSRSVKGTLNYLYVAYADGVFNGWLKRGWAVVRTDYEGLGTPGPHPYLVGDSEGRGVVDMVRAARRLNGKISKTYAIAGHSQGGQAANFAGALGPKYAPELKLRGVVSYAPASHLLEQGKLIGNLTAPGAITGLVSLIAQAAALTTPSFDLQSILSPEAKALLPQLDEKCVGDLGSPQSFGSLAPSKMLAPGATLDALFPALAAMNPPAKISVPVLLAQGETDSTVFKIFTDQLVKEMKAGGTKLKYATYKNTGHADVVSRANKDATGFLSARLR